jgi:hypothetical protein
VTVHQLLPLTTSGDVTLTGGAQFLAVIAATNGVQSITSGNYTWHSND